MITEFSSKEMNGRGWQETRKSERGPKISLVLIK
jgi:hypothetical protein